MRKLVLMPMSCHSLDLMLGPANESLVTWVMSIVGCKRTSKTTVMFLLSDVLDIHSVWHDFRSVLSITVVFLFLLLCFTVLFPGSASAVYQGPLKIPPTFCLLQPNSHSLLCAYFECFVCMCVCVSLCVWGCAFSKVRLCSCTFFVITATGFFSRLIFMDVGGLGWAGHFW